MRFQVPQFIETEEKIIGPLTLKQFFWIGGGASILFILFISFNFVIFIILGLPITLVAILMAFLKVDGIPLYTYAFYAIKYFLGQKRVFFKPKTDPVRSTLNGNE